MQDCYISYIRDTEGHTGNRRVAIFCIFPSDLVKSLSEQRHLN